MDTTAEGVNGVVIVKSESFVVVDLREDADAESRWDGGGWSGEGDTVWERGAFEGSSEATN